MWRKTTENSEIPYTTEVIIAYDRNFGEMPDFAFIVRQHVMDDIAKMGYSRITHWRYPNSDESPNQEQKEPEQKEQQENFEQEEQENFEQEPEPELIQDWVSDNGKWKIKFNDKESGTLIDQKHNKTFIWNYKNGELTFTGIRDVPKYVINAIKSCVY